MKAAMGGTAGTIVAMLAGWTFGTASMAQERELPDLYRPTLRDQFRQEESLLRFDQLRDAVNFQAFSRYEQEASQLQFRQTQTLKWLQQNKFSRQSILNWQFAHTPIWCGGYCAICSSGSSNSSGKDSNSVSGRSDSSSI